MRKHWCQGMGFSEPKIVEWCVAVDCGFVADRCHWEMATRIKKVASRRSRRPLLLLLSVVTALLLLICLPWLRKQGSSSSSSTGSRSFLLANNNDGAASSLIAGNSMPMNRPKVMAFVGINTGFGSKRRREALRMTWYPSSLEEHKRWGNQLHSCSSLIGCFAEYVRVPW